jgi:hypothetical protein
MWKEAMARRYTGKKAKNLGQDTNYVDVGFSCFFLSSSRQVE